MYKLRHETNRMVGHSVWQQADGTIITRKHFADEPWCAVQRCQGHPVIAWPDANTRCLRSTGHLALDTVDGFPHPGDCWEIVGGLMVQLGDDIDWTYSSSIADPPEPMALMDIPKTVLSQRDMDDAVEAVITGAQTKGLHVDISNPLHPKIWMSHVKGFSIEHSGHQFLATDYEILPIGVAVHEVVPAHAPRHEHRNTQAIVPNHHSVSFDATANNTFSSATTLNITHTCTTAGKRYIAGMIGRPVVSVSTATYNSVSMSVPTGLNNVGPGTGVEIDYWDLVAPSTGSNTLTFTLASSTTGCGGSISAYGVDQSTPLSHTVTASGSAANTGVNTITTTTGELVFFATVAENGTDITPASSGWTTAWDTTNFRSTTGSYQAGSGSSLDHTATFPGANRFGVVGASLKAGVAIAFDATTLSDYQTISTGTSWNHTCSGSNRFLIVAISLLSVAGTSVSSITYNGVALSSLGTPVSSVSGACRVELWGLVAPATGTHSITVTLSASTTWAGGGLSFTGVHQTAGSSTEGYNTATATNVGAADATVNVTTVADFDYVVGVLASDDGSVTVNYTSAWNTAGALGSGVGEYRGPISPAAVTPISFTGVGAGATWAIAGIALRPTDASTIGGGRTSKNTHRRVLGTERGIGHRIGQ